MNESISPDKMIPEATALLADNSLLIQQNNFRAEEVRSDQFIDIFDGTDLFSYFTADIIKLKTVFTR
ncbi:hypothetical protein LZZ85_12585 [Terrimonas sp. NA20]|uniref:Uncharacterized protein n=1 Tax=Terrimonas ginsenosidimutans TaxID=2908004 RepID=A0ABS9KS21_9BACT|nr:hypothetical protein [Terrimonas ginsenosidimutans]MCG2615128.1 hypothetical protein [Terrimonas ginsenosidimutans]